MNKKIYKELAEMARNDLEDNYFALTAWECKHIELIIRGLETNTLRITNPVAEYLIFLIEYNNRI